MKWYAYSENNDGTVNMILDHNTTSKLAWVTSTDYSSGGASVGITYPDDITFNSYVFWDKGPITLLNRLKEDTSGWLGVPDRSDTYTNSNNWNNSGVVKERFTINYSGYKARLITADEIAHITGASKATTNGGIGFSESTSKNYYYFDSLTSSSSSTCKSRNTTGCSYGWLYDRTSTSCTNYGCLNNANSSTTGYLTASPYADSSNVAWSVNNNSYVGYSSVSDDRYTGLRPVITVTKSTIFD